MQATGIIRGNMVDLHHRLVYSATISFENGIIKSIEKTGEVSPTQPFIIPGFIDSHIHIESSMLTPYEFAKTALRHGTIATISDPHEIANVCGLDGVLYMIENAKDAGLRFCFGAPSCVPATAFETAGDHITPADIDKLLSRPDVLYLSEMMNYPGVLFRDQEVMEKISIAQKHGKPIDGHAPGLTGDDAIRYIQNGISTDHECFTLEEADHKVKNGMKILIREGSAARNFDALHPLIKTCPEMVMFCSDDKHPDELLTGHINKLVARAVALGYDLFDVLRCACINPIEHYRIPTGQLRIGDTADFITVKDLQAFEVLSTYINGVPYFENGACILPEKKQDAINKFESYKLKPADFSVQGNHGELKVIDALDGQLITKCHLATIQPKNGLLESDVQQDILKLVVVNRYQKSTPAVAFIRNIGIRSGAFASTVAHDSHNIIAVGVDDNSIAEAVNALMDSKGGLSVVWKDETDVLPLPLAGLMSLDGCEDVAMAYQRLDQKVKQLGCLLRAPFMTLSFMALLVIPELKLSDKGLFDGKQFRFTGLQEK
jgi:adenine deaminase